MNALYMQNPNYEVNIHISARQPAGFELDLISAGRQRWFEGRSIHDFAQELPEGACQPTTPETPATEVL